MKLEILNTLKTSFIYVKTNIKLVFAIAMINFVLMYGYNVFGGMTTPVFFVFLALAYCLWVVFFRIYFNKKPFFKISQVTSSLVPSIKILLFIFLLGVFLVFLPYLFMLVGVPLEFFEYYINKSKLVDIVIVCIFTLCSPFILYRPYFAWIGSVIERNKNINFAFNNTKGNYIPMLVLFSVINGFSFVAEIFNVNILINCFITSVLFTYFNIVLAKSYELFFIKS